jgi:hypothetical protein
VGPRPHAIADYEQYRKLISGYMIRPGRRRHFCGDFPGGACCVKTYANSYESQGNITTRE